MPQVVMKTQELDHLIVSDNPPRPVCCECGVMILSTEPFRMSGGEFFHATCYEIAMDALFADEDKEISALFV